MLIFSKKKKNTRIYTKLYKKKTLIQRKSTYNIMNKMQDERDTDQIQHLEKKQLTLTFADQFFRQTNLQVEKHTFSL